MGGYQPAAARQCEVSIVTSPLRILLLEDDPTDAALIQELLEADNIACEVTRAQTHTEFLSGLEDPAIELILADYKLPSFDGLSALKLAQDMRPDLPFIFVSGTLGEEVAIGQGKVDFKRVFEVMHRNGYTGAITIEREISGPKQIDDVKRGIEHLNKAIAPLGI